MRDRIKRNTPALLSVTFYADGTPTDDPPVTVTATWDDGSVLVTAATTGNPSPGVYTYALAAQPNLGILTLTWTGGSQSQQTEVEIVGGFYVTEATIRAMPNMADPGKFTDAKFLAARQWFEDTFEDFTGIAWVPRYARVTLDGTASASVILPHMAIRTVRSVTTASTSTLSTPFTTTELADLIYDGTGVLRRWNGSWVRGYRYTVAYEHGHDHPPSDVVEAAKVAIRDRLLAQNVGNRQYAVATEAGVVRNSTPGVGRPFGIPEVDAVAVRRSVHGGVGSVAIA